MERMTGTIIKVRLNLGYAFLRDGEGMSRFIYAADVDPVAAFDTLHEGRGVTFEPAGTLNLKPGAKNNGLRALKVRVC